MDDFKDLQDWANKLAMSKLLVIVEGKNDIKALNKLGVTNIRELKKPLYAEVESIASLAIRVVILTDCDKEGKKLYGKLKKDLNKLGVKIDGQYREFLLKSGYSHIEGLKS